MGKIEGITVQLWGKVIAGYDGFGKPIYEEQPVDIDNVLVGEPSTEDVTDTYNLTGKRLAYTLAIPKGDRHCWINRKVSFFGQTFRTIGEPTQGIDGLIPLDWNQKVMVGRYD